MEAAVTDSRKNAQRNGITNSTSFCDTAKNIKQAWNKAGIKQNVLVVAPSRKELIENFITASSAMSPRKNHLHYTLATMVHDVKLYVELAIAWKKCNLLLYASR